MNRKIFFSLFAEANTFRLIVLCNSIFTQIISSNQVGKSQKCHWVGEGEGGGGDLWQARPELEILGVWMF